MTPFQYVLVAQFLSALADNALLFIAIALVKAGHYPAWAIPVLQECFVAAYIGLAPFAGPLAEILAKSRLMLAANGFKLLGAALLLPGLNPFVAYGLVGVGAALYSPAKYGILRELVPTAGLVKANGYLESSTIVAILAGVLLGGWLADTNIQAGLYGIVLLYALAGLTNLRIPAVTGTQDWAQLAPRRALPAFYSALRALLRVPTLRISLMGTSLFWSSGATLRLYLVAWVPAALAIQDIQMPAYLNAGVALGIVVGAAIVGHKVSLESAFRVLPAGTALGAVVLALAFVQSLPLAVVFLVAVGALGGLFVVPLNAVLQEEGHAVCGAGPTIAAQNFCENLGMLGLVGIYAALSGSTLSVPAQGAILGCALTLGMVLLWRSRQTAPR